MKIYVEIDMYITFAFFWVCFVVDSVLKLFSFQKVLSKFIRSYSLFCLFLWRNLISSGGVQNKNRHQAILGQFCPIFCQSPRTLTGREFFREAKERSQRCSVWIHSFKFKRSTSKPRFLVSNEDNWVLFFFRWFFVLDVLVMGTGPSKGCQMDGKGCH